MQRGELHGEEALDFGLAVVVDGEDALDFFVTRDGGHGWMIAAKKIRMTKFE
ncbi:hypothetical protein D3C83_259400 [compost metagenome]